MIVCRFSAAFRIDRARVIDSAIRRNEPLDGCPYTSPDLVRAYTLGAAAETLDSIANQLEQAITTTEDTTP